MNPFQMIQQLQNNPLFQRAQQMANGKSEEELKQVCKNLCQQRGINIDEAAAQFKSQFGGIGFNNIKF